MSYNIKLKANEEIFDKIKFIDVQNLLVLKPIVPDLLEEESHLYSIISNSQNIKKYLPTVYADNKEKAKLILKNFIGRIIFKQSLFYSIRIKDNSLPVGYINLNSPISSTGLGDWSIDFWMSDSMTGKGLMSASLQAILIYLQENKVPVIYAQVEVQNQKTINVLNNLGFGQVNFDPKNKSYLYGLRLNT